MSRREKLQRLRKQVQLVRRLSGQMRELAPDGLRSIRMDGLPRGRGGTPPGLEANMERREALERMIRRESEMLRQYEDEVRSEMAQMKPEHYAFCAMYYIGGFGMEETAEAIERSARQCARYKRELETA